VKERVARCKKQVSCQRPRAPCDFQSADFPCGRSRCGRPAGPSRRLALLCVYARSACSSNHKSIDWVGRRRRWMERLRGNSICRTYRERAPNNLKGCYRFAFRVSPAMPWTTSANSTFASSGKCTTPARPSAET